MTTLADPTAVLSGGPAAPARPPLAGAALAVARRALLAAAAAIAATPWLRAYHVPGAAAVLVAAAAVPVAVAAVAARRAVPAAAALTASAAALVGVALVSAGPHPAGLLRGVALGPAHLLSETLPLRGGRQLLALPLAATWVAAAVAGELDERADRTGAALAVAPLAYAGAWALTAAAGHPGTGDAAALLAVTAAAAALRHGRLRPRRVAAAPTPGPAPPGPAAAAASPVRAAATGLAASVAAVAVVAAAVPAVSGRWHHPATLRRAVPVARVSLVDPVDTSAATRSAAEAAPDPATALEVTTGTASTGYLATAVVDRYDGAAWAFDATFLPTGGRVPAAPGGGPAAASAGEQVTQDVTVGPALPPGPLPALDRAVVATGTQVAADAATGMLLATGGRPARYRVTSSAPAVPLDGLPGADALLTGPGATLPAGSASDVAAVLRSLAAGTGERPAPTVGWLQAAAGLLRRVDRRSVAAGGRAGPAGTDLAEVINATTVGRVATPEQFATLLAVVCRYLGVPARVATGYRIPGAAAAPGGRVPPGAHRLTGRDAWTWAEVPVPGIGWVVADATPSTTSAASAPPPLQVSATPTSVAPRRAEAVPATGTRAAHALARPVQLHGAAGGGGSGPWGRLVAGLLAAAAALLALPAAAALARLRRRAARRPRDPRLAAVGAWLEVLDGLERGGLRPPDAATPREVEEEVAAAFGPEVAAPVRAVGDLAERAALSSTAVAPADAAGAWSGRRQVLRLVHRRLDRRQQLRAAVRVGHAPRRPTTSGRRGAPGPQPPAASRRPGAAARRTPGRHG